MKKIILLFIATIISLFAIEILFHILNYQIKLDEIDPYLSLNDYRKQFIKEHYLEIYDNFFVEKEGYYVKQRSSMIDIGNQRFKKNKDNNLKRIFIVGESVAAHYDIENFKENLETFFSKKKFEIINTGMGSYDSYRIEKILKEISNNYEPDYIIMMIGNNDGHLHNPITINYLPYKYKIFRKSYILNAISNLVMPRYRYNMNNIFPFFKHNVEKMIKDINSKCPMIFVTLPQNDENENIVFEERRSFIRSLPDKFKSVYVADFDKELKTFIKKPKYDVFLDNCHYHKVFYDLISKLIICEIDKDIDVKLRKIINRKYIFNLLEKDIDFIFDDIEKYIKEYDLNNFIEYIKKIDKEIDNYDDEYRADLLRILIDVYRLYENPKMLDSNEEIKRITNMLDDMVNKYPDKESSYILKALFYFKIGNMDMFEENIKIALQINPKIVKKLK